MSRNIVGLALLALLAAAGGEAAAQWAVGVRMGWTGTSISRYDGGRMDESYSPLGGLEVGLQGRYKVSDWLAVRADLSLMQRSHRMDRNLNYLDPVYTEHINSYIMLPVTADFSFGGEQLRGHLLAGGYGGYWASERRCGQTYWMTDYYVYFEPFDEMREITDEDQRLKAGAAVGAAITYSANSKWEVGVETMYYYDLTSHHRGTPHLADPRYLNTLTLTMTINYNL